MITKSRARFGVSRELAGLDPGRGDPGVDSKIAEKCTGFRVLAGVGSGPGRVVSGSRARRGRVEGRSRVGARISDMGILQCVSQGVVNSQRPIGSCPNQEGL